MAWAGHTLLMSSPFEAKWLPHRRQVKTLPCTACHALDSASGDCMCRKNLPITLAAMTSSANAFLVRKQRLQQPSNGLHRFTRELGMSLSNARARGIEDITKLDYLQMLCEDAPHARVLQTLWALSGHFTRIGMALLSPAKASKVRLTARSNLGAGVRQCRLRIHPLRHCGTPQLRAMLGLFSPRNRINTHGRSSTHAYVR